MGLGNPSGIGDEEKDVESSGGGVSSGDRSEGANQVLKAFEGLVDRLPARGQGPLAGGGRNDGAKTRIKVLFAAAKAHVC